LLKDSSISYDTIFTLAAKPDLKLREAGGNNSITANKGAISKTSICQVIMEVCGLLVILFTTPAFNASLRTGLKNNIVHIRDITTAKIKYSYM